MSGPHWLCHVTPAVAVDPSWTGRSYLKALHAAFPPQSAKRWPGFGHKPRNQKSLRRNTPETGVRYLLINRFLKALVQENGV